MDQQTVEALIAYERTIRIYRNPYRDAPEFPAILRALRDADEYYRLIPDFEKRPEQIRLARKVRAILDRRRRKLADRRYHDQ